jgi:two-component system response regulator FlrC
MEKGLSFMASDSTVHAIWLDPLSSLQDGEREALAAAGVLATSVSTLDDLRNGLMQARMVVIRLAHSVELLKEVQQLIAALGHQVPVVCRVHRRDLELTVAAMREGALHVVPSDEWSPASWQVATSALPQPTVAASDSSAVFVDPTSQHLLALAQRVAQTDVTALLVGPTGAGKEVLARVLHESSPRAKGPFVALNCAALPENLIEDLLFGHEKGAFTGALREHKGLFEQAQGGTIFLDEIGEMPLGLQAKLLRILQERRLRRLGGQSQIALDVRVVAATNKDLKQAIANREFREDLYFRISTFRLTLSPLAQRPGDILPLVATLLAEYGTAGVAYQLSPEAEVALLQYPWPGNVRELSNVVQRAMVLCPDGRIGVAHLLFDEPLTTAPNATTLDLAPAPAVPELTPHEPAAPTPLSPWASAQPPVAPTASTKATPMPEAHGPLSASVRHTELQAILSALHSTDSRTEAAKQLGISPRTLRYKIAQLRQQGAPLGLMNA